MQQSSIRTPDSRPELWMPSGVAPPRPAAVKCRPMKAMSWTVVRPLVQPVWLPLSIVGRVPEPYDPITSGLDDDWPLTLQNPKPSCQVSPFLSKTSSPVPLCTSFWARASDRTGELADRPLFGSLPPELLT